MKLPIVEPPWLQPRLSKLQDMGGSPILRSVRSRTWAMYSYDGDPDTFVPPEMESRIGLPLKVPSSFWGGLNKMNGSIACRARPVLPAVLMSSLHSQNAVEFAVSLTKRYAGDTDPTCAGMNSRVLLPFSAPSTEALLAYASQLTHAKCCALSPPPPDLLPRMLVILTGMLFNADMPTARRRSCPPPSRVRPSSSTSFLGIIECKTGYGGVSRGFSRWSDVTVFVLFI